MGEDYLFMVNDFGYDSLKNMSATFVDLSQYSDSSNVTGDKYLLNGTNLMKELGLDGLKDNMYLCFLDISAYQDKVKNNEKIQKKYAEALEYLQTLLDVK